MTVSNEELLFGEEKTDPAREASSGDKWKILIVDDEEAVHNVTRLALKRLVFQKKGVRFISAYSAAEAVKLLGQNPDIAVVLLDVVMEEDNAGLKLAHHIRREMGNRLVRIILRTGHPGQAPEQSVIMDYDINDYKEKTELTTQKLHTTVVSALRSFQDLSIIDTNRRGLQKIIESSSNIFQLKSMAKFASGVLDQLVAILFLGRDGMRSQTSSFAATKKETGDFYVLAATGNYDPLIGQELKGSVPAKLWLDIEEAFKQKRSLYFPDHLVMYYCSKWGLENLIYLEGLNQLSEWDHDLVEVFSMNVSVAFDNIYLNEEVEATQKEIIFTLGEIAEARSQETGHHVKRVAELSKLLALKYGLPPDEAELLRLAAPTHDLGKLAIADYILNKPGKLTAEEFEIMKTHSQIGYEMLRKSSRSILQAGAIIALQHHERYDGSGYPRGLKGEEIHIYGRIVGLTDVFDALGNERVYKKAWPLEETVEYIRGQRGRQFDPVIVGIFLDNLDEIMQIRQAFPDGRRGNE